MVSYINDKIFDLLTKETDFLVTARPLIEADWREGTTSFTTYVKPLIDEIFSLGISRVWGDLNIRYVEMRVMEGGPLESDPLESDPWLWAFKQLTGAFVDDETARAKLNAIARKG